MTNDTPNEWEKRFDDLFYLHRVPKNTKQSKDIKDFIHAEIFLAKQQARQEAIEECKVTVGGVRNEQLLFGAQLVSVQAQRDRENMIRDFSDGQERMKKNTLSALDKLANKEQQV